VKSKLTRRQFLGAGAATAAGAVLWKGLVLAGEAKGANEKLQVGSVGVSGRGEADLNETAEAGARIVALCDVNEKRAAGARKRFPDAKFFVDFRRMLDEKGIDAVTVGTPDHTHATISMAAIKSGRHVYCEKPLTRAVGEARKLTEAAFREKRVTQMGTQIHNAGTNYRHVVRLVQGGAIGKVTEVHVWCGKDWGQPPDWKRPADTPPVPEGFDWDLWLGPSPLRPYHPCYTEGGNWRRYWDFGGGTLSDMACHYMDLPFWALKLKYPVKASAEGPPVNPEAAPQWTIARWEFPARDDLPPVKFAWYDGGKRPAILAEHKLQNIGDGVLFVGEKGMLFADYGGRKLLPEDTFKGYPDPNDIPDPPEHHLEWVEACKKADATNFAGTTCNFGYSGPLAETVLLGNVAYRLGKPFDWDGSSLKASVPEAAALIMPEYRPPWTL
jgi:predicted dehydrogenase